MIANSFGKAHRALMNGPVFFFFKEGEEFFFSFPCSQCVPNTTLVLFHIVCPKFNSHVYNLKRWSSWEYICFYFASGVPRGASIG
jgi:hypothetical protein